MGGATGAARYVAEVNGFALGCEVRLSDVPPPISEVVLRSPNDHRLEASVSFKGLSSLDDLNKGEALRVAAEFVEEFAGYLASEKSVVLEPFRLVDASFETDEVDEQGGKHYALHLTDGAHIEDSVQSSLGWGKASVDSLVKTFPLRQPDPQGYRCRFLSALRRTAGVDRFMALYRLLIEILGKQGRNQKEIDRFIVSVEPAVQRMPWKGNASKADSIYTSIRNDISHRRGRNLPAAIAQQAEQHSAGLGNVVREAIRRRLTADKGVQRGLGGV